MSPAPAPGTPVTGTPAIGIPVSVTPVAAAVPYSRHVFIRRHYRGPESNPRKAVTP
ncbi:hypothetical protein ACFZAU_22100 [Streptomyces sp. NPDC008238]